MTSSLFRDWSKAASQPCLNPYVEMHCEWTNSLANFPLLDAYPGVVPAPTYRAIHTKTVKIYFFSILIFGLLALASAGAGIGCAFHYPKVALILIAPFALSILGCFGPTIFFKIVNNQKEKYLKSLRRTDAIYNPSEIGYLNHWITTSDLNQIIREDFLQTSSNRLEQKYGKEIAAIYQKAWGLELIKNECNQLLQNLREEKKCKEYKPLCDGLLQLESFFNDADETNYISRINLFVQQLADLPHSDLLLEVPVVYHVERFHEFLRAYGTHTEGAGFVCVIFTNVANQELITIPLFSALKSPIISTDCRGEFGVIGKNCQIKITLENESERIFWHLWSWLSSKDFRQKNNFKANADVQDNILDIFHLASEVYQIKTVETYCLSVIQNALNEARKEEDQETYLTSLNSIFEYAITYHHEKLQKICFLEFEINLKELFNKLYDKVLDLIKLDRKKYENLIGDLYNFITELNVIFNDDVDLTNYSDKIGRFLTKLNGLPQSELLKTPPLDSFYEEMVTFLYQFKKMSRSFLD